MKNRMRRIAFISLMTILCFISHPIMALPNGAVARLGKGRVTDAVFMPKSTILAVATSTGIYLYDWTISAEIGFIEMDASVTSASFSPDGSLLATGMGDATIRLWDVKSWKEIGKLASSDIMYSVSFSPDGKLLASGDRYDELQLWDVKSRKELALSRNAGHTFAFSPNGWLLACGGADHTVRLCDIISSKDIATLKGHSADVYSIAFSPDGNLMVSASYSEIKLWDVENYKEITTFTGRAPVLFSPDGGVLISVSEDSLMIKLWDVKDYKEIAALERNSDMSISSMSFSPDGRLLACANNDSVILWDMKSYSIASTLTGYSVLSAFSFSPDGSLLASGGYSKLTLWDVKSHKELITFKVHDVHDMFSPISSIAFSPDGNLIASANLYEIKLWDMKKFSEITTFQMFGFGSPSITFSPDGSLLAGAGNSRIKLWDVKNRIELATLYGSKFQDGKIAFSPDGSLLASVGTNMYGYESDMTVRLWNVKNRKEIASLNGCYVVAFSPDGSLLVSGVMNGEGIKLWDVKTLKEITTIKRFGSVAFSPDGRLLAIGDHDGIILWDLKNSKELATIKEKFAEIAFSPDGSLLASLNYDNILLWDMTPYVSMLPINHPPFADLQSVTTNENTPVNVKLSGKDFDGNALMFKIASQPSNGSLNGTAPDLIYTPKDGFYGTDMFTFTVNDGTIESQPATVTITINHVNPPSSSVNHPPSPGILVFSDGETPGEISTDEDKPVGISLIGWDLDKGDKLTFKIIDQPLYGTLIQNKVFPGYTMYDDKSGISATVFNLLHTPEPNFNGFDTFTFITSDGISNSEPLTITITVKPVNDPPAADSQSVTTYKGINAAITLTGSDIDGDKITFKTNNQPKNGSLSGVPPNLTYKPKAGFTGSDSFTFIANDGTVDSQPAAVNITVASINDPPAANNQTVIIDEDTPIVIELAGSDPDGNALTFKVINQTKNGSLSGTVPKITYTPNTNFNGSDSFTFIVNDGTVDSQTATVAIKVLPINDPPVPNPQAVNTDEDTSVDIILTGNDPDGDALTFNFTRKPNSGSLTGTAPLLRYTPNIDFNGSDSFYFTVNDGTVDSESAIVNVRVSPVNDPPTAIAQTVILNVNTSASIILAGKDPDDDKLTYNVVSQPKNGSLIGTAPNLLYKPNTDFDGSDSLTFTVNDGKINSQPAAVAITVNPIIKPGISIITPANNQILPAGTTSTILIVSIVGHSGSWRWKLSDPFPASGAAGGNQVTSGNTIMISGLQDGRSYIIHVALVNAYGNMLNPAVTASVMFSVAIPLQKAEFVISTIKTKVTVISGETATYLIQLEGKGSITLACHELPSNIKSTFEPRKFTLSATEPFATSQLTLVISGDVAPGEYPFTVIAVSDNGGTKQLPLTLKIEPSKLIETILTFNLEPGEVSVNSKLRLTGQLVILRTSADVKPGGARIQITFIAPSGKIRTYEAKTDDEGNYQLASPLLPDEAGKWSVNAQFDGNSQLRASRRDSNFTVTKGLSEIVFDTDTTGALGKEIDIQGCLKPELEGALIDLKIARPGGTSESFGIHTELLGIFRHSGKLVLDAAGDWEITAAWSGNDQYKPVSKTLVVNVPEEKGKVIIVLGASDKNDESDLIISKNMAEYVYYAFIRRGFDDQNDIYFLSPDPEIAEGADHKTTMTELETAITKWAATRVNAQVPLYIYLLSYNGGDQFLLERQGNDRRYLTPVQLDAWLDKLPESVPLTIIIEACYSGSFIRTNEGKKAALIATNRTVITSARNDERSYIGVNNLYSFSKMFFDQINRNKTISEAFSETQNWMTRLKYSHPEIDADGDGNINTESDFAKVKQSYIPAIMTKAMPPEISSLTKSQTLPEGASSLDIRVKVDGINITRVYATGIPPDFDPGKLQKLNFAEVNLVKVSDKDNEYAGIYTDFTVPGDYTIIVDAENPDGSAEPKFITITVPLSAVIIKGDVNNDGKVNSKDAILVLQYVSGLKVLTDDQKIAADINNDGKVDSRDTILILRKSSGYAAPGRDIDIIQPEYNKLFQNFPNPFNPETWIPYQLAADTDVVILIYNPTGQLVRKLDLGHKLSGSYTGKEKATRWDGRNEFGEPMPDGVYFYNIQAGNYTATKKMLILR